MSMFDLTGKVALVTGGTVGLGAGMATALAEAGADLVLVTYTDNDPTMKNAAEAMGRRCHVITADLSKEEQLPSVVEQAIAAFGHIDILVNNAGIIRRAPIAEHASQDWHDVINLNMNTVFFLTQLVGRHMIERGSGKVISVASMLSYQGGILVPGYTASKHAVAGLTKAFANEWASKGVNVNAIAPGYMETRNTAPIRADSERTDSITARIPAGRWGQPEDLGGPVVFLASQAADYLHGHVLNVDGGWMAR
ncbi:2-dehydro-3-deoxy-D-gluconate 5-dehydrogenase KduD [Gorillibacterium sp. sgz5001074]|uniref:2-dehydro-3-deoxy-D-gluconate 5-dehydrogenase KduD n=1 Tax=Gorillibacterium sp. sgz5001074 TaxID=3446695 RepID=UPI003F669DE9